jgi:hypothetical protein
MATDENCYEFRSKAQDIDEVKINLCPRSFRLVFIEVCAVKFFCFWQSKRLIRCFLPSRRESTLIYFLSYPVKDIFSLRLKSS